MQPELHSLFARERLQDDHSGLEPDIRQTTPVEGEPITIRPLAEADLPAVERLADLDERRVPPGALLLAEIAGRIKAALAIESGETIADPFTRTCEAVALLRLRADQLRAA